MRNLCRASSISSSSLAEKEESGIRTTLGKTRRGTGQGIGPRESTGTSPLPSPSFGGIRGQRRRQKRSTAVAAAEVKDRRGDYCGDREKERRRTRRMSPRRRYHRAKNSFLPPILVVVVVVVIVASAGIISILSACVVNGETTAGGTAKTAMSAAPLRRRHFRSVGSLSVAARAAAAVASATTTTATATARTNASILLSEQRMNRRSLSSLPSHSDYHCAFVLHGLGTAATTKRRTIKSHPFLTTNSLAGLGAENCSISRGMRRVVFRNVHSTSICNLYQRDRHEDYDQDNDTDLGRSGYRRPVVQWYPGHIAKAERMLKETFKAVDVVVEVRDARAPKATSHPMVGTWCAGRPRLVVLTHADQVPTSSQRSWNASYRHHGAEHPEERSVANLQVQNEGKQAAKERLKYSASPSPSKNGKAGKETWQKMSSSSASPVEQVLYVNARVGSGVHGLTRAIFQAGGHVQERRERRGLKERPLRVGVIGYPNVGKSALINKLLGRRRARTANTPGITRTLQWIRIGGAAGQEDATGASKTGGGQSGGRKNREFELLDSPGIIPANLVDQSDATLLAACNCIGDAAYDNQAVAAYLCEWLIALYRLGYGERAAPEWPQKCLNRYGFDPTATALADDGDDDDDGGGNQDEQDIDGMRLRRGRVRSGEDMLFQVADNTCMGNPEDASRKILQDFRTGRMGPICLQVAPPVPGSGEGDEEGEEDATGQGRVGDVSHRAGVMAGDGRSVMRGREGGGDADQRDSLLRRERRQERARAAMETARERGLELPPSLAAVEGGGGGGNDSNNARDGDEQQEQEQRKKTTADTSKSDVGKGLFDGW